MMLLANGNLNKDDEFYSIAFWGTRRSPDFFRTAGDNSGWRKNFIAPGKCRRFLEHGSHGTILVLAELDGVLYGCVGGSAARSPEQITSSDSSLCRFFSKIMTTSVAVQAPSANNTSSIGPGALFELRSESTVITCPDGLVATNCWPPIHFTDPVCMWPPPGKHSRTGKLKRAGDCNLPSIRFLL